MADHSFKVGQRVRVSHGLVDRTGSGIYEIIRSLPESQDGELHYRVRGSDKVERAIRESQVLGVVAV